MSCPVSELVRGAVCLALYPYTTGFPMDRVIRDTEDELRAQLEAASSIEEVAATLKGGDVPEFAVSAKLRRVLLLQTGTSPGREDIAVARINSITDKKRTQTNWYLKLQNGIHIAHFMIGNEDRHGTAGLEAYVDCMSVSTIRKAAILERVGVLSEDEMREITERLMRTLELDLSAYLGRLQPKTGTADEGD
jgi:hypothetical protein